MVKEMDTLDVYNPSKFEEKWRGKSLDRQFGDVSFG